MLVLESGRFAIGWGNTAAAMGAEVEVLKGDWHRAIRPAEVEARLRQDKNHEIKAILAVQVDTASGAYNDIEAIGKVIKATGHPALFMVDAVASLGCMPFEMDAWGIDVAMSGSQKGLMLPPGLGFNAISDKALAAAKTDQARARAEDFKQRAAAKAADLGARLETARADAKSKLEAAAAAKEAAKAAQTRKTDAARAASEAKLALEPVSVYISRATQKLYVRRNTHRPAPDGGGEVFDATIEVPVTIRDPDRPIGTHVFTAMAGNDAGLRWSVVTVDKGDDAKDALDRITIPPDVLGRIAPTALPRSSIIISDEPLSRETNYRTEFIAVLNDQPQGGFVTRKPTVNVNVASGNGWDDGFGSFFQRGYQTGYARRGGGQYYYRPVQRGWW
ncbi:MAG: hypothetical protein NVS2B1_00780 [Bradyrhizobium sp.]